MAKPSSAACRSVCARDSGAGEHAHGVLASMLILVAAWSKQSNSCAPARFGSYKPDIRAS